MTILYSRSDVLPDWLRMGRLQVQVWNILSQGPLNAWEIHRRLHGSDYDEIIQTLKVMTREGTVTAEYSH